MAKKYETIDDRIFNAVSRAGAHGISVKEISQTIGRSETCVRKHIRESRGNIHLRNDGKVVTYRFNRPIEQVGSEY